MKKKIIGVIALTRLVASFPTTLIATLGGMALSGGGFGLLALILYFSNWLNQIFLYAINDVEDADDDAHDSKKALRNPISNGTLTKKEGYLVSFVIALLSIILMVIVLPYVKNTSILAINISGLIVGFLYSWKPVRFKSIPIIDVLSHSYMLGVVPFLAIYFAFTSELNFASLMITLCVFLISFHGDLDNENRDFDVDKKTNIKNTVQLINNLKITRGIQIGSIVLVFVTLAIGMLNMSIPIQYYIWFLVSTVVLIAINVILTKLSIIKKNYVENTELIIQFTAIVSVIVYIIFNNR